MSNTLLTIDMIGRKTAQILENSLVVTRNADRQYDPSFSNDGAKIGTALRIRLPDRALVKDGATLQVDDDTQQYTTLNVTSQRHIAVNFTTAELTMKMDDFADRVLKPRVSQLAASIDNDVCSVYKQAYMSVGTPGTVPGSSLVMLQGQQKLNEMATPSGERYLAVTPAANAGLVEGMKGLFNPGGVIDKQFRNGAVADNILGYDEVSMTQSLKNHTTGDWGTTITVTNTISTQGTATIDFSFTGSSKTWKEGDVFTVGSVYAVNPQTRESTGSLQQFVITADKSGSSTVTGVAVSPAMYTSSQALATIDAFPQATAVVTMLGSAATVYPQNLGFHKNAIAFATADLIMPKGVHMATRVVHNGISLRIVQAYDIVNDRMPCRIDVLYGYKLVRPETAFRMWG